MEIAVRPIINSDLPALHVINQTGVPGVSSESQSSLAEWINLSTGFTAVDAGNTPLGFMTLIEPGTLAYDSENLRWFERYIAETGADLIYVDRIAIAKTARDHGVGSALYHAAFAAFADRQLIGCEINIEPPNLGSMRFHERLGFSRVGERAYDGGRKSVAYYVRKLSVDFR